ncbi:MAG: DNA-directed RNA polymerase subunit omega [Candidatus Kapaibacteriales bacterium]
MRKKEIVNPVLVRMKESEKGIIYESIVAMGIRARQINDILKQELTNLLQVVSTSIDSDEPNFDQLQISKQFDNIPKPTVLAMKEMYESQLEYFFPDQTEFQSKTPSKSN